MHEVPLDVSSPQLPAGDVWRAVEATLRLLSRRLDCMLDDGPPADLRRDLRRLRSLADEVLDRLRVVAERTADDRPRPPDLATALRRLGVRFARATGACVDVHVAGPLDELGEDVSEVVFAVACEALRNVERHGRATLVSLSVEVDDNLVVVDIKDDGVDLAQREAYDWQAGTRTGVVTVAGLVESLGGRVVLGSCEPRGLRLVAEVPRRGG